ncbi:MAG TPA: DUF4124 domain-containing protein [Casimicrobiaceae bacterium]|nr:DUF4124 domain-containing protein [Casimicrobiaceae bacterium]HXU66294.1 DUF4124 domain-containing protein [Casimicrobiaceae bacterium]
MSRATLPALAWSLLAATLATGAQAALYKWTDAQGHVVYSDQPPQGNVKTEQLHGAPPPANPNAAKELAQREADFRKRQTDAAKSEAKAGKERSDSAQHAENCTQARGELKQLSETQTPLYRYTESGTRQTLDDEARNREREKVAAWLRDNKC